MKKLLAALALASALVLLVLSAVPALSQSIVDTNTKNHLTVFQQTVSATATALPAYFLANGLYCTAKAGNTATVEIGGSTVTTTATGAGNGLIVSAGTTVGPLMVNNSGLLFIIGTVGDVVSCWGN
jgi:hypothetical protein